MAQEAFDVAGVGGLRLGALEERSSFLSAAIKPQFMGVQEEQNRVVGVLAEDRVESAQVVRVVGDIGAVQLDGTEASRRPSRLQGHAGVNCVHGVSVFSEREESLRE